MCGGGGGSTPAADPVAEREKAQAEATQKANQELLTTARRKRIGKGLLATGQQIGSVFAPVAEKTAPVSTGSSVSEWGNQN